jgi:hypothetical protein
MVGQRPALHNSGVSCDEWKTKKKKLNKIRSVGRIILSMWYATCKVYTMESVHTECAAYN